MAARNNPPSQPTERELTITRVFDAPRSLVFKAWTEPEWIKQWWGPRGAVTLFCNGWRASRMLVWSCPCERS